jgi:hypothetical protein
MTTSTLLKIPKRLAQVVLQVHPEGRVVGFLFVSPQSTHYPAGETPLDLFNAATPFVVLRRTAPDELRFYNKNAIIRVECEADTPTEIKEIEPLYCRLQMMDGTLICGNIRRHLHPDYARLSDYLNLCDERFIEIFTDDGKQWLVNKSYIVYVTPLDQQGQPCVE